jgi:hypothetical protein
VNCDPHFRYHGQPEEAPLGPHRRHIVRHENDPLPRQVKDGGWQGVDRLQPYRRRHGHDCCRALVVPRGVWRQWHRG